MAALSDLGIKELSDAYRIYGSFVGYANDQPYSDHQEVQNFGVGLQPKSFIHSTSANGEDQSDCTTVLMQPLAT